jgi:hypothetical protein
MRIENPIEIIMNAPSENATILDVVILAHQMNFLFKKASKARAASEKSKSSKRKAKKHEEFMRIYTMAMRYKLKLMEIEKLHDKGNDIDD